MQDKSMLSDDTKSSWRNSLPVFRYAIGATLILGVAMAADYTLAYITPVLALGFIAPGVPPVSVKAGAGFVITLLFATFAGVIFSHLFLDYPLVFIPMLALALLHLYYTSAINQIFKIYLIISLSVIPLISITSFKLGEVVAIDLVINAAIAILLIWLIFFIFPYREAIAISQKSAEQNIPSEKERFVNAMNTVIVILPLLTLFFIFHWTGSLIVLIFVMILTMIPAATNVRTGLALILANLMGGVAAILVFALLTIVPEFIFLLLMTLLMGLFFGKRLFSEKPAAKLYGSAFSTFLLVLGSVTTSEGSAGAKVWSRVFQIGMAVVYVVVATGLLHYYTQQRKKTE